MHSDPNAQFTEAMAVKPPEAVMDPNLAHAYNQELQEANQVPLEDNDDEL